MARILIASRRRAWRWIERGLSTPLFLLFPILKKAGVVAAAPASRAAALAFCQGFLVQARQSGRSRNSPEWTAPGCP
ncbi:MAG: hypothetical protein WBF88_16755, partial [Pusillimonas sp.]